MRPLLLGVLLALAACAQAPEPPGDCRIAPVATLPLEPAGYVTVDGELNRQKARFLLDTGADGSGVAAWAPEAYGLERVRGEASMTGIGGLVMTNLVSARIGLGGDEVRRTVPVVDLPVHPATGGRYAALLGTTVLAAYDLEISFPERRVRLWQTQGCRGRYALWGGAYWSLPLAVDRTFMLRTAISVDGAPFTALLDTGAGGSVLTRDAAERLGVTAAMLAADPGTATRGIGSRVVPAYRHRFGAVGIGPERVEPVLMVSDIRLPRADMLLGADWMQSRRVWISWTSKQVFVQPADAIRPPAPGSPASAVP